MKIARESEGPSIVTLLDIEPFFLDLLVRIVESGNPGDHPAARERLFSAPVAAGEPQMLDDWKEYVEPELSSLFRTAQETVEQDLAGLPRSQNDWTGDVHALEEVAFTPTEHRLSIPREHAAAWLSALNQARLVISARRGFDERAMSEEFPLPPFDQRQLELFQVHFYDDLQQLLLQGLGYD